MQFMSFLKDCSRFFDVVALLLSFLRMVPCYLGIVVSMLVWFNNLLSFIYVIVVFYFKQFSSLSFFLFFFLVGINSTFITFTRMCVFLVWGTLLSFSLSDVVFDNNQGQAAKPSLQKQPSSKNFILNSKKKKFSRIWCLELSVWNFLS